MSIRFQFTVVLCRSLQQSICLWELLASDVSEHKATVLKVLDFIKLA